jgi:ethanolamine ammonia-lyase small subunit
MMDNERMEAVIRAVVKELSSLAQPVPAKVHPAPAQDKAQPAAAQVAAPAVPAQAPASAALSIDLADPTTAEDRARTGIAHPADAKGLAALMECTIARIGVGRAGPAIRTRTQALFQADLAVTKGTLARDVDPGLLQELGLFTVETRIQGGKEEFLLRPDLGRLLSDQARQTIAERCVREPDVQICVGDGLSAQAVEVNLRKILPVLQSGCASSGLKLGTPFFIRHCRVGVMNDIGDLLAPKVVILLIGERPGLGRADSLSAYMGYRPKAGDTDAERDVVCNIFDGGGANPLEAGAYALRLAQRMLAKQASGVKLRLMEE